MANYERIKIYGSLVTLSDLHIGSGDSQKLPKDEEREEGSLITLLRGDNNQPYIPASSLRGYLRSVGNQRLTKEDINALFGYTNDTDRKTGLLRVSNAFFMQTTTPQQRIGIALDPVTATVNKRMLFRHEVIPANNRLTCSFTLEKCNSKQLNAFLSLLKHWDGSANSTLGAMTGKGYGRVKWQQESVTSLSKTHILQWLEDKEDTELESYFEAIDLSYLKAQDTVSDQPFNQQISFTLQTQDPIVVHDPRHVDNNKEHSPKITCSRTNDDKALIPGTSLKGLLRAWCRKIVMTILVQHYEQLIAEANLIADEYINDLFGTEKLSGYIQLSDAISPDTLIKHTRPMIAIDRFSGGVLENALLTIEAALNTKYEGDISFNTNRKVPSGNGWKGLLLLALRDSMQADLAVGWGKSRGFGGFSVALKINEVYYHEWGSIHQELRDCLPIEDWVTNLHQDLHTLTKHPITAGKKL